MSERVRERPLKRLQVCQLCGAYMRPISAITPEGGSRHWKDETFHRSFGGKELKKFVCEKCSHVETFQVDDLEHLREDD